MKLLPILFWLTTALAIIITAAIAVLSIMTGLWIIAIAWWSYLFA
ncbi:hypothetical protein [Lacticaseibacillus yichunensis]|uniref:Uncharacterized protein n=1 Tax=Lacticaseibacillus yichunensis TaxID=2486015 RepID=A0ABW4CN51_9LACO|nr:hypothetical protein [Lacticaseibacillus yichunensis]